MHDPRDPRDTDLARALDAMAPTAAPPPVAFDLASAVRRRIECDQLAERRRRRHPRQTVLAAAAAVVTLIGGAVGIARVATATPPKSAVAAGRGHVAAAPPAAAPVPADTTTTPHRTTLAAVRDRLGFPVMVPAELGQPDAVIDQSKPGTPRVMLVYTATGAPSPVQVVETPGSDEYADAGDATLVHHEGFTGFWYEAPPHIGIAADRNGWLSGHPVRDWNTLLWQTSGITIRLDSKLSLPDAITLASSMTRADLEKNLRNLS